MKRNAFSYLYIFTAVILVNACANISHPTGGEKDVTPPQLLSVTPADSQLHTKVTKLELRLDEYVTVSNASSEVQVSPLLPFPPTVEGINKTVSLKIPDSLLQEHTTYRIRFGNAIADLHEGNVFSGYSYIFSTGNYFDSLQIHGKVFDAFTGAHDTEARVILYPADKSDSIVVKEKPVYAVKADAAGSF